MVKCGDLQARIQLRDEIWFPLCTYGCCFSCNHSSRHNHWLPYKMLTIIKEAQDSALVGLPLKKIILKFLNHLFCFCYSSNILQIKSEKCLVHKLEAAMSETITCICVNSSASAVSLCARASLSLTPPFLQAGGRGLNLE